MSFQLLTETSRLLTFSLHEIDRFFRSIQSQLGSHHGSVNRVPTTLKRRIILWHINFSQIQIRCDDKHNQLLNLTQGCRTGAAEAIGNYQIPARCIQLK